MREIGRSALFQIDQMKTKRLIILALFIAVISCEVGIRNKPVEPSALPVFIMNDGRKSRYPSDVGGVYSTEHDFRFLKVPNPRMTQLISQGYLVAEKPIREGSSQDGELRVYVFSRDVWPWF